MNSDAPRLWPNSGAFQGRRLAQSNASQFPATSPHSWRARRLAPELAVVPGENFERILKLVERIEALAMRKRCTKAQLALSWVLAQGDDIVPIPGTKRRNYLEENVAALNIELTPAELEEISAAAPPGAAAGTRYPEESMQSVNR